MARQDDFGYGSGSNWIDDITGYTNTGWPIHSGVGYRHVGTGAASSPSTATAGADNSGGGSIVPLAGRGYQSQAEGYLGSAAGYLNSIGGMADSFRDAYSAFAPIATRYASAIRNYDPQYLVDQAAMDARTSYDKSQGIMTRNMLRYGINPNSGRFANLQSEWARALAAAEAGAKTKAARTAYMDKINALGQGVNAMTSLGGMASNAYGNMYSGALGIANQYGSLASGQAGLAGYQQGQYDSQAALNRVMYGNQQPQQGGYLFGSQGY